MDTGKILMGTAMLLLMIGLLVHPVGAAKTGDMIPVGQVTAGGGSGQAPAGSDAYLAQPGLASGPATHPYERLTTTPATISGYPVNHPWRAERTV
ncbi:MAG: hypothetical protein WAK75_00645 [Methanoregula sp.]|uniref:hypothetical protein n=1 Tax=Methanoregula sp. TaxID=2052170 RepID=UPI003BAE8CAF